MAMLRPTDSPRGRGLRAAAVLLAVLIICLQQTAVGAGSTGSCSSRGTYNAADGTCTCDVGFGGEDCSINLLELSSIGTSRKLQSAGLEETAEPVAPVDPAARLEGLLSQASAGADSPSVPFSLRNMLMYADTLVNSRTEAAAAAGGGRHLLDASDPFDSVTVGCGFYDLFYEGCGTSSQCFYNSLSCTADAPFYDFYTGDTLRHAPEQEYFDDFLLGNVFGERGFLGKSTVVWSHTTSATSVSGDNYLGGLSPTTGLTMQMGDLPAAPHEVIMSFDFLVDGSLGSFSKSPVMITVLGEGTVEASAVLDVTSSGQAVYQLEFKFDYSTSNLKLKIQPTAEVTGTWGIDKVMVSSMVTNYPPVAEDKQAHISSDPVVGGTNTIELRGFDQECEDMEYHVTSLPTEGKLFHCGCDSIWTTPITPADLPAVVPGPCHRLVYEPAANEPKEDLEGNPFDAFQYRVKDAYGEYSNAAFVKVFIDAADLEDTPVSGAPGLAIACDGEDDIVSVSWVLGEVDGEFTVEMRFKVTGDGAGTLAYKSGSYWLGWTEFGGLGASVMTTAGEVRAETLNGYTDRMWHHVAMVYDGSSLTLYVDAEVAASRDGGAMPLTDASSYLTLCSQLADNGPSIKVNTAFNGHIDDVRLWGAELDAQKVAELYAAGYLGKPDEEEGLKAYYDFNLGANVPVSSAVFDRTSAHVDAFFSVLSTEGVSSGLNDMFPTYVTSTAVYANVVTTLEDTAVTVQLHGGDLEGGVTFWVATMPVKGDIVDAVTGKTVLTSPAPVTGSTVIYHPKGSANGKDVFKYQAFDGTSFSYKSGVLVDITPVNDPPSCAFQTTTITSTAGPTLVQLQGSDADADAFLSYTITRPPRRGHLYQSDITGQKLELIDESMTSVGSTSAFVLYEPRDVGNDVSEGFPYDAFAYSVHDKHSISSECVVDISIPDDGCDPKPVSGDAGYALRFDGTDDLVHLGAMTDLLPQWPFEPEFSLGLHFRTSYVTTEGLITLARAGPLSLQMSKVYGLAITMGSRVGPTFEPYNEGGWHRVVMTFDGASAKLFVDGDLKAALLDVELPAEYEDVLILGYTSMTTGQTKTGYYNGQVDEVSLWADVVDAVSEDPALLPSFSGYENSVATYPSKAVAHWNLNEAQGVMLYNGVTGQLTDALGANGDMATQPRWVASTVVIGDAWNVTEDTLEIMNLACASEYTDVTDAVLLTLPGQAYGGGRLWYTDDGVTPLYPITQVPTVLKEGKVIYEPGTLGDNTQYVLNYGDFGYVCIGDLQRTLQDHLSGFDFYGVSTPTPQSALGDFLSSISDIIRNLPTPPDSPPPVVGDAARDIYAKAPAIDQKTLNDVMSFYGLLLNPIPPPEDEEIEAPPTPKPVDPPTVEDLAQIVLADLIDSFFPEAGGGINGAAGVTKISAVNVRVQFVELAAEDMLQGVSSVKTGDNLLLLGKPTALFETFLADYVALLADYANVSPDQVQILSVEAGSVIVNSKVSYSASNQASAQQLQNTAATNGAAIFAGPAQSSGQPFALQYGTAVVTDVSTEAVFVSVQPNVAPSCFQLSQIAVTTVNAMHSNHMPQACAGDPATACRMTIQYGAHADQTFEIDAVDVDGDNLEVRITYLAQKGTLLAPYGTFTLGTEAPVQGDLFDFYIKEGSLVAMDPSTGKFPLVYSPQVNAAGMPFDSFGFVISDGVTLSKEYTVTIDVEDNALLSPLPTAGNTGYSLSFDGVDDFATLGPLSAYGMEDAVTFALWVKTGSSPPASGMTVLSAGKYRLYWTKLGGLVFSVTQGDATAEVTSTMALNDLFWHHVIAASDGETAVLYVDGMSVGAVPIAAPQRSMLLEVEDPSLILGARQVNSELSEFFNGVLDEVVVFNKASPMLMASTSMMRRCGASHLACFEGDEDGLVGYWRFNEVLGAELTSEVAAPSGILAQDMRLGSADGMASTMPQRAASTVPLLNTVELLEDTHAEFALTGVSHDLEDPTVHITFLPAQGGRLYIDNTTKLAVGSSFPMSKMVLYKPKDNFNGVEMFGYVINDGTMTSDVQVVKLVVHPQNDLPEAADFTMMVDFKDPAPVEITLKARDVDNDITHWVVTTLPIHGTLYQSVAGDFETSSRTLEEQVVAPNTVVTSPIYYVPMVNDASMHDYFSYVVEADLALAQAELALTSAVTSFNTGNEQTTELRPVGTTGDHSRMATVILDGTAAGLSVEDTPVVGLAGLALQFDGIQTVASLGMASDFGLMMPGMSPVTFSAYVKTSFAQRMTLLKAGPYKISWEKVTGLQFSVGTQTVATYASWNDGMWHLVVATYNGETMTLSIDSTTAQAPAEWDDGYADADVHLGADIAVATSLYNGFVDDLIVGSSEVGFFRFNEPSGNVLVNEGAAGSGVLGANGVASTQPLRVSSTAPIRIGDITLEEDEEVTVELIAHNTDAAATGVKYVITELPANGTLYTTSAATGAKTTAIKASQLPKTLAAGVDKVVFVPAADTYSGADTPYAQFSYAADIDGAAVSAARSAFMTRRFYVLPVNDTPRLATRFLSDKVEEANVSVVSLMDAGATDVETESLEIIVTFLPAIGLLYQYDDILIAERNTVVTDSELRLKYVPPPNLAGSPLAAFGFVASDGELMSEAGTVSVSVMGNSAIDLSMGGSVFVGSGGIILPPQLDGAFTVDAWVRVPNEGLPAGVWSVVSTAFASLTSTFEDLYAQHWPATLTRVNPMPDFELGRWHHIAYISDLSANGGAMLYVDGKLVALQAVVHEARDDTSAASPLVIGAPANKGQVPAAFAGKVDEVRVWNRGLLQYEVITSMNLRAEPALNAGTGNEAVGKGIELYLAPDLHEALVAYWSFDDISDSGVVPDSVSDAHGQMVGGAAVTKLHAPMAFASREAQDLLPLISTKGTGYALHMDGVDDSATGTLQSPSSIDGVTVDLWFKTGNSLGFMALVSVGDMSVHWTQAGGLGVHIGTGGSLHSFHEFSDGVWHHLKATAAYVPPLSNYPAVGPGGWKLSMTVDDLSFGPVDVSAASSLYATSSEIHLGASSNPMWAGIGTRFSGTLDFSSATTADGMGALTVLQFDGPYSLMNMVKDMSGNGAHATMAGSPTWVFSTAPKSVPKFTVLEDSAMTLIHLLAADADGDILKYYVTHLPENGRLYIADGEDMVEITEACPAGGDAHDDEAVCTPIPYTAPDAPQLYFMPNPNAYGTNLVQYVADDGMVMSDPTFIVIDVQPVNDLPVLDSSMVSVQMDELSDVVVTLPEATDIDIGTVIAYAVSTLPKNGKLYQYPMESECSPYTADAMYPTGSGCYNVAFGGEITVPGTPVTDPEHRLVYLPTVNGMGAEYDMFGFQVTDGNVGSCAGVPPLPCPPVDDTQLPYYSQEGLVSITVGQVRENSVPVAGHAGYALEFDGMDDVVTVNLDSMSGPVTLELWVKTSAAVDEFTSIATMVASGADPDYLNLHLTRFGAIGLDAAVNSEVKAVYSFATVNDGTWHHVAAFFDGMRLGLVVDGELCDSCTAMHTSGYTPSFSTLTLGPASPTAYSFLFAGQLDDIRVWDYVLAEEEVAARMHTLLHGDEEGLSLWFPLDGQSTKNGVIRDDASNGVVEDGDASGNIKWVASSAPIHALKYDMNEDTRQEIDLYATDADFDPLQFYVMSVPADGHVYPENDSTEPIAHVPYLLPSSRAFYQPGEDHFGGPMFDEFRYAAHDGSVFSNEAVVVIDNVAPVADPPVLHPVAGQPLQVSAGDSLIISLSATDPDYMDAAGADMVMLKISVLPKVGTLYQVAADGMSMGDPILVPGTALTATHVDGTMISGKVMFVPDQDYSPGYSGSSERSDYTTSFGVAVQDLNSAYRYGSGEQLVEVHVTQEPSHASPLDITAPLGLGAAGFQSGMAGQAVLLDGEGAYITAMNSTTDSLLFGADGSFTVEMYFKTTAALQEKTVLCAKDGAFSLGWRRYFGLTASLVTDGGEVIFAGSKQRYNDGSWHHVAATWLGEQGVLSVYVDGEVMDQVTAVGTVAAESGPLVLGSDGKETKTNFFAGFVDEVRVWPAALDAAGVAQSFAGMPNGDEGVLMSLHYTFNSEPVTSEVTDSSGNGHHAMFTAGVPVYLTSSTPVYMKNVVVTQDTTKTITLLGADADGDAIDFRITTFPSHGSLVAGTETIDYVPYKLTGAEVIFVPGPQAATDTSFTFVVSDGKMFSAVATVVIEMVGLPDGPTALPVPSISTFTDVCGHLVGNNRAVAPESGMVPKGWWKDACDAGEKALYQVTLSGYDSDGDDITFHISTLPQLGRLYQASTSDSAIPDLTKPISAPGTIVEAQDGLMATVWFSVQDVDFTPVNLDVFFGYAVAEADGSLTSSEQIVSVMLTQAPQTFTLYSGVKGYAIYFDGSDAAVEAPAEAAVTDVSVEAWFRSSGAVLDGATLISSPGFRLGWTSYGGLGLHFFGVASNLHSGKHLNDGEWHHVAATIARPGSTTLYIDGAAVAVKDQTPSLDLDEIPILTVGRSAMPQSGGVKTQYRGQMDEIRLWTRALTAGEVMDRMNLVLHGDEEDLATYLRFNRGDIMTSLSVRDLASSSNASAAVIGNPSLVSSSAPVMMLATCEENGMVMMSLTGGEALASELLRAIVTELPTDGVLYHASSMQPITAVPTIVQDPMNQVIFAPTPHTYGNASATPTYLHSVIRFITAYTDGSSGSSSHSDEDTIVVVVTPVNYPPLLTAPYRTYAVESYSDITVHLEATDMDDDNMTFVITTLPTLGVLHQTPDGVTRGPRITAPGTALEVGAEHVLYSPILVDDTDHSMSTTYFGYTVMDMGGVDGSSQYAFEPEALVMFNVSTSSTKLPPLAGDATGALLFSGFSEPAELPAPAALSDKKGLTIEAWMKSSAALARINKAVLLGSSAFSLEVGRILGLSFSVTSSTGQVVSVNQDLPAGDSADLDVNDGAWHFVAATFRTDVGGIAGATQLKLYVDGSLVASTTTVNVDGGMQLAPEADTLYIGQNLHGLVDEVRVWDRALSLEAWAPNVKYNWDATGMYPLTGNEKGLMSYWRFNEPSTVFGMWDSAAKNVTTGFALGSGVRVPSGAPLGNMLKVPEDKSIVYCMQGNGAMLMVTMVPEAGALYQSPDGVAKGAELKYANTVVSHVGGCIIYEPETDFFGADSFAYVTHTAGGLESVEVTVAAAVAPVNDLPEIVFYDKSLVTSRNLPISMRIVGSDVDHPDTAAITITALPYSGHLYNNDKRVTGSMGLGSDVELSYMPVTNLYGNTPDAFMDDFTFSVVDPDGGTSATVTVPIYVLPSKALKIEFGQPITELEGLPELSDTFTLSLWIKSEPLPQTSKRRSLSAYQLESENRASMFVDFATEGADVESMAQANYVLSTVMQVPPRDVHDGQWHHIAAIFDGSLKTVHVDGRLDTSQTVTIIQPAVSGTNALGASTLASEFLTTYLQATANLTVSSGEASDLITTGANAAVPTVGILDDLRIYGRALTVTELRQSMTALAADQDDLLYHNTFDSGLGELYVPVNAAVAGEAGYAISPVPGSVVVIGDDVDGTVANGSPFTMDPFKAFTVSIWFKTSRACSSMGTLVAKGALLGTWGAYRDSNTGGQWTMQFTSAAGLGFHILNTDGIVISANSFETYCDGSWHLATGIYDGENSILYVDGQLKQSTSMGGLFVSQAGSDLNANVIVGGDAEAATATEGAAFSTSVFYGHLDDLKVWEYIRSEAELLEDLLMSAPVNTTDPGLRAWYRFNDAIGIDVLPQAQAAATQQELGAPPRTGTITGQSNIWVASTLPVPKELDILGFNTPKKIRLYCMDADGDVVEPVVTKMPERGTLWASNDAGEMLRQLNRVGEAITRFDTPDGLPVLADWILYIPGDYEEAPPLPYASFAYGASDGREIGPSEVFTVNVYAVNQAPVANPATIVVKEDTPTTFVLNVYDPEGQSVFVELVTNPERGILTTVGGSPASKFQQDSQTGEIMLTYRPAPDDVSTQTFMYVAIDSEGQQSEPMLVTIIIECQNDAPVIGLARDIQETYRGQKTSLLIGVSVSDVDSFAHEAVTVTVSVPSGALSTVSAGDAQVSSLQQVVLTGTIPEINAQLGLVFFYNREGLDNVPVSIVANDNHNECDNGPQQSQATLTITIIDSPFDNVAFTDDGRAIIMVFTCEVDIADFTDFDCSRVLTAPTLEKLGAYKQCYSSGPLTVNPLSKVPCPVCSFDSIDRRTYTITVAPGATIVPGDTLATKGAVLKSLDAPELDGGDQCPLGELLVGDLHPAYVLPVNSPLAAPKPTVEIDGPNLVGKCNPIKVDGLQSTNSLGRMLEYSWTVVGPEPLPQDVLSYINGLSGPMLELPADIPFGFYTIGVKATNWLRATQVTTSEILVEKIDLPIPTVYIKGPDTVSTKRNLATAVRAQVEATLCEDFCQDPVLLQYSWSQTAQPFGASRIVPNEVTSTGVILNIPANKLQATFNPNSFYEFEITVTDCLDPSVSADATSFVNVVPQPLTAAIFGGDRDWYNAKDYILDGSYSTDPDSSNLPAPGGALPHLEFTWSAFSGGVEITDLDLLPQTANTVPGSTFGDEDVVFSLTVTSTLTGDTREANAVVTISFTSQPIPEVYLNPILAWKLNPSTPTSIGGGGSAFSGRDLTFRWGIVPLADAPGCARVPECEIASVAPDLDDLNVAPGGSALQNLYLLASTVNPGRYELTLTACESESLCASAKTAAVFNSPPVNGLVSLTPTDSRSCEGSEFIVLAHSFSDMDVPISYDFGFFDESGMYFSLTGVYKTTGAVILLPNQAVEVGVRVTDGLGAFNLHAAPADIPSIGVCNAPDDEPASVTDLVNTLLDILLPLATGTGDDDLTFQVLTVAAGVLITDPPGVPESLADLETRQAIKEEMAKAIQDEIADGFSDTVKALQAMTLVAMPPEELNTATVQALKDTLDTIISKALSGYSPLDVESGSMALHLISNILEAAESSGPSRRLLSISTLEREQILEMALDTGRAVVSYSYIPNRVPITLPAGSPPIVPAGAAKLRVSIIGASASEQGSDMSVGNFLISRDTVDAMTTANGGRRLLDLSALGPMQRVVIVTPDFMGNVPPPINVFQQIADPDGEPITAVVGLRAYNVPDCPAEVIKYDYSAENRMHCNAWFDLQDEAAMTTSAFEEPIPDSNEPITLSLMLNPEADYDAADQQPLCKAIILGDVEWTSDMMMTDDADGGIVCSTRTFGDFAAFAVPRDAVATPPPPPIVDLGDDIDVTEAPVTPMPTAAPSSGPNIGLIIGPIIAVVAIIVIIVGVIIYRRRKNAGRVQQIAPGDAGQEATYAGGNAQAQPLIGADSMQPGNDGPRSGAALD